jgi:hypothetical protein
VIPAHGAGFSSHACMRLSGAAPQSLLMARWRLPAAPEAIVPESGRFKARRLVLQIGGQVGLRKALDIGASFAALMVTGAITWPSRICSGVKDPSKRWRELNDPKKVFKTRVDLLATALA